MPTNYRESSITSHSNEVEHRLTRQEWETEHHSETLEAHAKKLSLHEKAILGILGLLQIVLQDKYPALAALIKGLL